MGETHSCFVVLIVFLMSQSGGWVRRGGVTTRSWFPFAGRNPMTLGVGAIFTLLLFLLIFSASDLLDFVLLYCLNPFWLKKLLVVIKILFTYNLRILRLSPE